MQEESLIIVAIIEEEEEFWWYATAPNSRSYVDLLVAEDPNSSRSRASPPRRQGGMHCAQSRNPAKYNEIEHLIRDSYLPHFGSQPNRLSFRGKVTGRS